MVGETTVDESVTGVGNNGSVDGVGNHGGGVVSRGGGVVSGGGVGNNGGSSVVGLSLVGHISNIAIIVVGVVLDVLDPAVGKVDRVLAINNTGTIIVLSLVEGSSGVVIGNSVGVGVGGNLSEVISSISGMGHGGVVSGGGVVDRGVIGGGGVVNRGRGVNRAGRGVARASHGGGNAGGKTSKDLNKMYEYYDLIS